MLCMFVLTLVRFAGGVKCCSQYYKKHRTVQLVHKHNSIQLYKQQSLTIPTEDQTGTNWATKQPWNRHAGCPLMWLCVLSTSAAGCACNIFTYVNE
jgi:hypothetical protein